MTPAGSKLDHPHDLADELDLKFGSAAVDDHTLDQAAEDRDGLVVDRGLCQCCVEPLNLLAIPTGTKKGRPG
jgi:hypothetical protein